MPFDSLKNITKQQLAENWLPRYTGMPLEKFGKYILLTNFISYVHNFADMHDAEIFGEEKPMQTATSADNITIINFGIGSPNAATICDLLSAIDPDAVLFLGKCGGLKKRLKLGDFILPIAAIRGEGTSNHYFPPEVPALPSFQMQKAISYFIEKSAQDYYTGTIYTTNIRLWEHDDTIKSYLEKTRCIGIDMETATFFMASFANSIPHGALLLVSDLPMIPAGIKTEESDRYVSKKFSMQHLKIGCEALRDLKDTGLSVKHLIF